MHLKLKIKNQYKGDLIKHNLIFKYIFGKPELFPIFPCILFLDAVSRNGRKTSKTAIYACKFNSKPETLIPISQLPI
jgi:hypothetical protein